MGVSSLPKRLRLLPDSVAAAIGPQALLRLSHRATRRVSYKLSNFQC